MATVAKNSPGQHHHNHHHHQQQQQQQQQRDKNEDPLAEASAKSSSSSLSSSVALTSAAATSWASGAHAKETGSANNNTTTSDIVVYDVEHLATFSTTGSHEANNRSANNDGANTNANGSTKPEFGATGATGKQHHHHQNSGGDGTTTPKVALQRLFELEKQSGIWTQRMQIELREDFMLIIDCETNSVVERFDRGCVTKPEAFNQYNDIYNNIIVFIIQQHHRTTTTHHDPSSASTRLNNGKRESSSGDTVISSEGELHIFQCVSHKAQQLVSDILDWKSQPLLTNSESGISMANSSNRSSATATATTSQQQQQRDKSHTGSHRNNKDSSLESSLGNQRVAAGQNGGVKKPSPAQVANSSAGGKPVVTVASSASTNENVPIVNVNVKETVQVFNQIAALREKSKPSSPTTNHSRPLSDASAASSHSTPPAGSTGPEPSRMPLSPGGQLYKQRSIRATLAPKYVQAGSGGGESLPANEPQELKTEPSSNNSVSAASSSSSASSEPKTSSAAYHNHQPVGRHAGNQSETDGNHMKQTTPSNACGAGRSSQHHQTVNPAHHKSSKSSSSSRGQQQQQRSQTDSSRSHASSSSQSQLDQVTTNESYVSVLNHCFDDIEKFIIRLQQAVAAIRELQAKRKLSKRSSQTDGMGGISSGSPSKAGGGGPDGLHPPLTAVELAKLNARARGPSEDDYFEILSKFKLAFNLLAKLKGCIHEPNAPELVHFLFTPLAIIIESARNAAPPIDPTIVGIPFLNQDALDLLSNCCTSKESDMWLSLGPNWTRTVDINVLRASRLPSSFQPIFSDGWAPIIGELELIGLVAPPSAIASDCTTMDGDVSEIAHHHHHHHDGSRRHPTYSVDETPPVGRPNGAYPHEHAAYSTGMTNGRSDSGSKTRTSRDYKKGRAPAPPLARHPDADPGSKSYPMPYGGYPHDPDLEPRPNYETQVGYRVSDHSARTNRFSAPEGHVVRRTKQSSRQSGYPSHHDPHYPATSLQQATDDDSQLDVDLLAHTNGGAFHSDDYTELHDHFVAEHHHSKSVPGPSHHYRSDIAPNHAGYQHNARHKSSHSLYSQHHPSIMPAYESDFLSESDHEAMLIDLGPAQTDWLFELQSRGAMIVRVLFTRDANNDKELSVRRGEVLEVLDDTRKWWRARNIDLQVAHVPHTIVAVMHGYQTLDELLANNPGDMTSEDPGPINAQRFSRREMGPSSANYCEHEWRGHEDKRNSKTAGAFRYF